MTYSGPINDPGVPRQTAMGRSVQAVKAGASFGSALAITISWSQHHSILWAMFQGFCSWGYVLYYALHALIMERAPGVLRRPAPEWARCPWP